jgi:hypothetical protein
MIEAALAECYGRISGALGAATKRGLPARTLDSKIKRFQSTNIGSKCHALAESICAFESTSPTPSITRSVPPQQFRMQVSPICQDLGS